MFGICHVSSYEGEARFACKRPPKDVRDKIEQILLKSSTDIRILSRFFWHFPNTQIYSKQQRISKKHWLRYWQRGHPRL